MRRLSDHRHLIRRNVIAMIGFCLCAYFSYNVFFGQRSILRLLTLNQQIAAASTTYDELHEQRLALEQKVVRMRPATLDRDLLEEQARSVLGFGYPGERIIMTAGTGKTATPRLN